MVFDLLFRRLVGTRIQLIQSSLSTCCCFPHPTSSEFEHELYSPRWLVNELIERKTKVFPNVLVMIRDHALIHRSTADYILFFIEEDDTKRMLSILADFSVMITNPEGRFITIHQHELSIR